jgi:Mg/Co/Ni transporter MgtE
MLVGAGGNASNQSAVQIIRELATDGRVSRARVLALLSREAGSALVCASAMGAVAFFRVVATGSGTLEQGAAIALAMAAIVVTSAVAGTLVPLALHALRLDPAHAGPGVQVLMDIVGVLITCLCCQLILD